MIYHTLVGFTPKVDHLPWFKKDVPNSIWVRTATNNKKEIEQTAIRKLDMGWGLQAKDIVVCDGNQFTI